MKSQTAYIVTEVNEQEKNALKIFGAVYSLKHKGWFVDGETYHKMVNEDYPKTPSVQSHGVHIENLITDWKISGNTYSYRDALKSLGARWNPSDKSWRIPVEKATKEDIESVL